MLQPIHNVNRLFYFRFLQTSFCSQMFTASPAAGYTCAAGCSKALLHDTTCRLEPYGAPNEPTFREVLSDRRSRGGPGWHQMVPSLERRWLSVMMQPG